MADSVFLTGATGFVGGHVLRALSEGGYNVRALVRGNASRIALARNDLVWGDLEQPGDLVRALWGCRYIVHCAAVYSFAPTIRAKAYRVNVAGTAGLLEAAYAAGVERVVVTSSASTVGASHDGNPVDERSEPSNRNAPSDYHASKRAQERAAFSARVPVVLLLPTAPIGPGDAAPTPTGRLVRDFARGRTFAKPPHGGMNLVPVEDVAQAHVRALTEGRTGERYLLGGENLSLDAIWRLLADLTGKPIPRTEIPTPLLIALGYADELRCRLMRAEPVVPLEGVRMAQELMYVDSSKARTELRFHPGSVRDALQRAIAWYRSQRNAA